MLIDFELTGDPDTAEERVQPILDTTAAAQAAHSDFVIEEFGSASGDKELGGVFTDDLKKAGELSLPITLGILLLAFGALVAAGIPLLLGLTAVIATMGLLAIPSKVLPMDESIGAVVLLIGLAVGVDYTMFYLKREREERAEGRSEEEALQIAAATSGRSVLISGLTVMIAMAGMFLTGDPTFKGFGAATILVVAVAVLGSLTVLPAMLSWLGDRVERLHIPVLKSMRPKHGEGRFWSAVLGPVLRHPIPAVLLSGGFLVALCLVALQLKTVTPGAETYPQSLPAVKTYNKMQKAFPGGANPAEVVIKSRQRALCKGPGGDRTAPLASALDGRHVRADPHGHQQGGNGRRRLDSACGLRHGCDLGECGEHSSGTSCYRTRSASFPRSRTTG